MIDTLSNRFCNMDVLSQVLILLIAEKERSHVAEETGITSAHCSSLYKFGKVFCFKHFRSLIVIASEFN